MQVTGCAGTFCAADHSRGEVLVCLATQIWCLVTQSSAKGLDQAIAALSKVKQYNEEFCPQLTCSPSDQGQPGSGSPPEPGWLSAHAAHFGIWL